MRKSAFAIAFIGLICATIYGLQPRDLEATKTVGHQARVDRLRNIESEPEPTEPRVCGPNEISTDRDPCLGANGRLDYQPGR